jgi:hypothetical protein
VYADLNAGDCVVNAFLNRRVPGSGKFATPCERMQWENLIMSCCPGWSWTWVGWPPELEELGEFEPQAAITAAAAIAATATGKRGVGLNTPQVVSDGRSHQCNTPALTAKRGTRSQPVMAV